MILMDRRVTVADVAYRLQVSQGSAYEIIHNKLGFSKVCARWVPKQLTQLHKQTRLDICQKHLDRFKKEGDVFLDRIVTCDETWVHHYEPETKRQSMEWKHPNSPSKKKFKTQPSAGKVMLTVFWDSQGPILEHYMEQGTTVNSARYSEMLIDELKPAIRSKRRGVLSKGVLLLHDNARPHTAAHTVETIQKLKFEVLDHPPYSPDLAPSDYHLFGPLKESLRGRRFTSDDAIKEAVHSWLVAQPKSFFFEGIRKLEQRWTKCVEMQGDYVEK
jgi:[histone H3]-lysine36 N-dimethyltransferase SETMAR